MPGRLRTGCDFYPRPPRGGRPINARVSAQCNTNFYPCPPRGGRRCGAACFHLPDMISIHALREEGDSEVAVSRRAATNFYPRPPRGGRRRSSQRACRSRSDFYPRPPRGGRRAEAAKNRAWQISIHALREEGDSAHLAKSGLKLYFYPRPPRGGRPMTSSR